MLIAMICLLLFGLLLLFCEAFVPGGILGTAGALMIGLSAWFCYQEYGFLIATIYFVVSLTLGIIVGVTAFLTIAKRMAIGPDAEPDNPDDLRHMIGKTGKILVDCDPTGVVEIENRRIQARTEHSDLEITKDTKIKVTAVDSTFLVVNATEE